MDVKKSTIGAARTIAKDAVFNVLYPKTYAKAVAGCEVNPRKAVFVSRTGAGLSDNFTLMYLRLRDVYNFEVQVVALRYSEVSRTRYIRNCLDMLRAIASARYVFLDDASDVVSCIDLRPGTEVIQLWHACGAFKRFGMSTADKLFGGTRAEKQRHPYYGNLSLFTVSSPEVCWAYREAIASDSASDVVQPLGISRTDVFFDPTFRACSRDFARALLPRIGNRRLLLYAPTFRGKVTTATGPDQLDVRALKDALGSDWFLVVKHHPFVKSPPPIPQDCDDFACFAPPELEIDELMCAADACITDYSSIVFEYALLERPIAFFAYDLEEYNDWRGFYYDYEDMTPGPVVTTNHDLISYLSHVDERFDAEQVVAFREKFMGACDGHATERLCEAVAGKGDDTALSLLSHEAYGEPLNLFFATRVGQLRNDVSYIRQTRKTRNALVLITTKAEGELRESLLSSVPEDVFDHVAHAVLPNMPVSPYGVTRRRKIIEALDGAVASALQALPASCVALHLHHPSAYYLQLAGIIGRHGADVVDTVLVEEGLSTYKWCMLPYKLDPYGRRADRRWAASPSQGLAKSMEVVRASWADLTAHPNVKVAVKAAIAFGEVPLAVLSGVFHRDLESMVLDCKDALLPKSSRFGIIERFDEGWFVYPSLMRRCTQLSFGRVHHLELDIPLPPQSISVDELPKTMFCSQLFGDYGVYLETVLSIFEEMGLESVLFKAHPREGGAACIAALEAACEKHPRVKVVHDSAVDAVLTESLVRTGHFTTLISLTSTSLVYAPEACAAIELKSIADRFSTVYPEVYRETAREEMPLDHLRLFERDREVLENMARAVPRLAGMCDGAMGQGATRG